MTFNQLLNACPLTFKCVALSDHYEFWCRQCSRKALYTSGQRISKGLVRRAEWQSNWQLRLSEELEAHQLWHENHPNESFEEAEKAKWDKASREAMAMLNKLFR